MAAETVREHKFDQVTALLNKADNAATPPDEAADREDPGREADAQVRLRGGGDPPGAPRSGGRSRRRRSGGSTSTTPATRSGGSSGNSSEDSPSTPGAASPRATGATGTPTATSWASRRPRLPRPSLHHRPALVLLEHRAAVFRPTTTAPWPDAPRRHRLEVDRAGPGRLGRTARSSAVPSTGTRKPTASRRRKATGARRRSIARASPKASWTRWRTGCGGLRYEAEREARADDARLPTGCRSLSAPARRWWRSSRTSGSPTSVLLRR